MLYRSSIGAIALLAALFATFAGAHAFDDANYPDWKGQWTRLPVPGIVGVPSFDRAEVRQHHSPADVRAARSEFESECLQCL
jgi:hypothetical protein